MRHRSSVTSFAVSLLLVFVAVGCTIENVNIRPHESGVTNILAEVRNHTGGYAWSVTVGGSLLDSAGTVIASPEFSTCPTVIKPYDTVVTRAYYSGEARVADYDLHVESIPMAPVPDASLSLSGLQVNRDEYGSRHILGLVLNTGSEKYEHVDVCVAFYDAAGVLDGVVSGRAPDVGPGQKASFEVQSSPFGEGPSSSATSYRVWVQPLGGSAFMDRGYISTDKLALP